MGSELPDNFLRESGFVKAVFALDFCDCSSYVCTGIGSRRNEIISQVKTLAWEALQGFMPSDQQEEIHILRKSLV